MRPVDLGDMAQAAIVIADGYASSGLDVERPIAAIARTLERHGDLLRYVSASSVRFAAAMARRSSWLGTG